MDNFNKYKDLTIVIVTFYSENIIYKCIESIGKNIKIIIVENSNNLELKKDIEKKIFKRRGNIVRKQFGLWQSK